MKLFLLLFSFIPFVAPAQTTHFPEAWTGKWKGDLYWFKTGEAQPKKVNMELRINTTDTIGQYQWQLIYGNETQDNRPYTLIAKDSSGIHWIIDEHNGILLDQYWIANRFVGSFSVMGNTILNSYYVEGDKLYVEFYSHTTKPVATTGAGSSDIPWVDSYRIGSYQRAILERVK